MKISLFTLSALFAGASASLRQGNRELAHSRRLELQAMEPRELVQQPECEGLLNTVAREAAYLVHEGDNALTGYVCNKIGRKDNKKAVKRMKAEVQSGRHLQADADAETICVTGFDRLLLGGPQNDGIKKGTDSMGSCKDEMAKEIETFHTEQPDIDHDRLRYLLENDEEHRELWGFFKKIGGWISGAVGKVKNLATTAFNRVKAGVGTVINKVKGFFSDRLLKHNIQMIGSSPSGIPVYTYQYKSAAVGMDTKATYSGVMAQDLFANGHADAVTVDEATGFYKVDYSMIDVEPHKLN